MTENTSENKPSIVDDFFSALFASNNNKDTKEIKAETVERPVNIAQEQPQSVEEETVPVKNGVKRERVLDEFDEYSILSKRKSKEASNPKNGNFRRQARNKRFTPAIDSPHILSKRGIDWSDVTPESRMLVRQLPSYIEKQDVMDYFSKYGEVVEVALKNSFGFVQFENPHACARAVEAENGQQFKGVVLDLEVCRRKPYFARDGGSDEPIEPQSRRNPPKSRGNFTTRSHGGRNNDFHNQNDSSHDNNKQSWNHSNSNYTNNDYDYKPESYRGYSSSSSSSRHTDEFSRSSEYRPDYNNRSRGGGNGGGGGKSYGSRNSSAGNRPRYSSKNDYRGSYTDSNRQRSPPAGRSSSSSLSSNLLPYRSKKDIPIVQVIAWGNVNRSFISYIENAFKAQNISVASATLQYANSSRDAVVKQMVMEGVKALVMVQRELEAQSKVNLQVFTPNEEGGGVRFDEYDGITVNEAVVIVSRAEGVESLQRQRQQQTQHQQHQHQHQHQHQQQQQQQQHQHQQQPQQPQQQQQLPQPQQYQQPQPQLQQNLSNARSPSFPNINSAAPTAPSSMMVPPVQNLDVNTLSTLYSMLQNSNQQPKQQIPVQPLSFQQPQQLMANSIYPNEQKPTVEQLWATIVNGFGANNSSSPTLQQLQLGQQSQQPQQLQQQQSQTSISNSPAGNSSTTTTSTTTMTSPPPQFNNQQPSIASLLSTVANGNPLLSQLLSQVSVPSSSIPLAPALQSQQNQQSYSQMGNNQLSDILGKLQSYSNTSSAPSTASVVPPATTTESWM